MSAHKKNMAFKTHVHNQLAQGRSNDAGGVWVNDNSIHGTRAPHLASLLAVHASRNRRNRAKKRDKSQSGMGDRFTDALEVYQ